MANGLEILGQGLRQTAQDVSAFGDRKSQYEEMVRRRVLAMQEKARQEQQDKIRAEQQAAEAKRQEQEFNQRQEQAKLAQQEKDRALKAETEFRKYAEGTPEQPAQPYLAPGMGPQGEAMSQPTPAFKPTREQLQDKALQTGAYSNPGVKAYMDDTNPTKSPEFTKELFGIKSAAQKEASAERMKYQQALEEYRQGRIDSRAVMSMRAAMERAEKSDRSKPKTESGMPLKALESGELKTLKDVQNSAYSIQKIRALVDNITGLKRGPIAGRIFGKNPYDVELQALERLVNQTVPGLARGVFGEVGVLTDQDVERYRKMLASVKDDPKLAQAIIDDLQDKIDSAYQITIDTYQMGGRDVSGFDPNWNSRTPNGQRPPPRKPPAQSPPPSENDNDPLGLGF